MQTALQPPALRIHNVSAPIRPRAQKSGHGVDFARPGHVVQKQPSGPGLQLEALRDAPNDEGLFVGGRFGLTVGTADVPAQREAFGSLPAFVTDARESAGFCEVVAENVNPAAPPRALLNLRDQGVPILVHGVSLGLGDAVTPSNERLDHLASVAELLDAPS